MKITIEKDDGTSRIFSGTWAADDAARALRHPYVIDWGLPPGVSGYISPPTGYWPAEYTARHATLPHCAALPYDGRYSHGKP